MLQLQWESKQPFSFAIIWQFRLLASSISRSFLVLYHTLVSPGIATSIIIVSLIYNHCLYLVFWPLSCNHTVWMVKSHKILKFSFSTTFFITCSYQSLALLNPSFSQNCQCTYLPSLSCLRLYSFWACLPHSLTI